LGVNFEFEVEELSAKAPSLLADSVTRGQLAEHAFDAVEFLVEMADTLSCHREGVLLIALGLLLSFLVLGLGLLGRRRRVSAGR